MRIFKLSLTILFILVSACVSTKEKESKKRQSELTKKVLSYAIRGDVKAALDEFDKNDSALSAEEKSLKTQISNRFVKGEKAKLSIKDPFAKDIVEVYHGYWNQALMKKKSPDILRKEVFEKLKSLSKSRYSKSFGAFSKTEAKNLMKFIKAQLSKNGYEGIYGTTRPHLDLMLWKKQELKNYQIKLHDLEQVVKVELLNDFVVKGWTDYATLGCSGTGGWADKEKLYCVASSYDLQSEAFNVSYLAHEGRHFSDYKRFPKLEQPELEYRAKLTELTLADETSHRLIEKFRSGGGKSKQYPHAFANRWVYDSVKRAIFGNRDVDWNSIPSEKIREVAKALLDADNKLRQAGVSGQILSDSVGPLKIKGSLGDIAKKTGLLQDVVTKKMEGHPVKFVRLFSTKNDQDLKKPELSAEIYGKNQIGRIHVHSPSYLTTKGIGIGATLEQILEKYKVQYAMGEGNVVAYSSRDGLSFVLDRGTMPSILSPKKLKETIPKTAVVESIMVMGKKK